MDDTIYSQWCKCWNAVDFLENELLVEIKTVADEIVTVTFENYLAHSFVYVMAESIVFDMMK